MVSLGDFVEEDDGDEQFHVMQVEYTEQFGDPIIHLWVRDENDNRLWIEVEGHYPSFYIHEDAFSKRTINHQWVRDVEKGHTSIHGDPLVKVECNLPKHVGGSQDKKGLREYFEQTWEADVFYTSRFLIDTGIKTHLELDREDGYTGTHIDGDFRIHVDDITAVDDPDWRATPRMTTIDIEVLSPDGFPEPDEANHPVTAITAHDNYTDTYTVWVLRHESWEYSDTEVKNLAIMNRPDDETISDVKVFNDESALLHSFNEYVANHNPDLLSGWNSSTTDNGKPFDYPYLINRCQSLNVMNYTEWSPMGQVWDGSWGPSGKGVAFFDMLKGYKKTQWQKPKGGYGLANISDKELDYGKEDIDDIDTAWRSDVGTFLKYNIRDVSAVVGINEVASYGSGVLPLFQNIRALAGVQFENCYNNIDLLDVFILRYAKDFGVALPTNTKPEESWYYGAHVFEPELGRHPNVVYPDVWSLYPNMIRNCNMSPETMVGTSEDLEASQYTEEDCRWAYIDTRQPNVKKDDDPQYEKVYFIKPEIKEGFMSSVVDDLMGMKDHYDGTPLYDAVKRIVNSCFTPDTEVLTPNGIRNITDIEIGDIVYSLNPDTGEMEEKPVVEVIEKPEYNGELVHIQNNSMDLKVTPDHRFLVDKPRHGGGYEYVEAGDLNEWTHYETPNEWESEHGEGVDTIDLANYYDGDVAEHTIRCNDNNKHQPIPRYYDGDDIIELIGWFISEGSTYISSDTEPRGDSINISQYKDVNSDNHSDIEQLFNDMGLHATIRDESIEHSGSIWASVLNDWCGEGSENKKIPEWVFEDASKEQKELLLETLMKGDGDSRETPKRYSTKSTQLRDDFTRFCWELGYPCNYTKDSGVWRCYWRTEKTNMSFRKHRDGSTETAKNGVYCIQVKDNHMLVAGRNGKFTNMPNCYGVFGDSDSYGKGYRLFDWRIAEGITLAGRKLIQDSADEFVDNLNDIKDERGYEGPNARLVGGDTDSVMSSIPYMDGNTREEQQAIVDVAHDAADRVNDWYDEWTTDTFNLHGEHYCKLEIESYAPWLFIPKGVTKEKAKKRYAEIISWDEGDWEEPPEFSVTGIDIVRSDRAEITRSVLTDVLEAILRIDDRDEARKEVYDIIKTEVEKVENGEYPPSYIARPKGMSKEPEAYGSLTNTPMPTYRGAKYANQHLSHEKIGEGGKPQLLYIDKVRGDYPRTYTAETKEDGRQVDAIAVEQPDKLPDEFVIDTDKMLEKTLRDPLTPILAAMNWNYDDALSDTSQGELSSFM